MQLFRQIRENYAENKEKEGLKPYCKGKAGKKGEKKSQKELTKGEGCDNIKELS